MPPTLSVIRFSPSIIEAAAAVRGAAEAPASWGRRRRCTPRQNWIFLHSSHYCTVASSSQLCSPITATRQCNSFCSLKKTNLKIRQNERSLLVPYISRIREQSFCNNIGIESIPKLLLKYVLGFHIYVYFLNYFWRLFTLDLRPTVFIMVLTYINKTGPG